MTTFTAEIPSDLPVQECLQTKKILKGLRPLGSATEHSSLGCIDKRLTSMAFVNCGLIADFS